MGTASGSYRWDGTASGKTTRVGAASGRIAFTGTASGSHPSLGIGSASGSYQWVGDAAGTRTPKASAAGAFGWAGSAAGSRTPRASTAQNFFGWRHRASGSSPHRFFTLRTDPAPVRLAEDYAVRSLRADVRDALASNGERCIVLAMYHVDVDTDVVPCPNCTDDVYSSPEDDCDICYGTTVVGSNGSGIKEARRVWAVFTDHVAAENFTKGGQQGVWAVDKREIQLEAFPLLVEHDYVIRILRWDDQDRPAQVEGYYAVQAVTRTSLRTGNRFGQWNWDVVGQRAVITRLSGKGLPCVT